MNRFDLVFGSLASAAASAALVVSATALPAPLAAQAAAPTGDLPLAIAALRGIESMKADFVQADSRGKRITGVMTLKRPGKIRFQYEKGVPFLVVSDGKALTFVDYQVRQVQRWPIRNSPLGALLDPNKDVMRFARLMPSANARVVPVEVRDPKHPEYGVITLVFARKPGAPGGLELSSWATLDAQNARTVVTLTNHAYGVAIGDNAFRFKDPRSATRR